MIRLASRAVVAAAMAVCVLAAQAQTWPSKPVHFVVPFPPGGSVDPLARMLGARLVDTLGQQIIVENKPGASGSISVVSARLDLGDGAWYAAAPAIVGASAPL